MLQKNNKYQRPLFGTKAGLEIASIVFAYPHKSFHIRKLASELKCSTTAVTEGISILKKYNIITIEDTPITKNIKANLESEAYRHYKQLYNLFMINSFGIIDNLVNIFFPECITLFGSFAKGEDQENSDIDIFILTSKKNYSRKYIIKDFEELLNRKINLHIFKSLEKSDSDFKNSLANGIILYGYLKVI